MDTKDRFGACVICHKDMIVERVVDGKVINMFSPEKDETIFNLDDGSIMPVSICKTCKNSVNLDDPKLHDKIMNSVVEGWQYQVDQFVSDDKRPDWTQEKADLYMEEYGVLEISSHKKDK